MKKEARALGLHPGKKQEEGMSVPSHHLDLSQKSRQGAEPPIQKNA